MGEMLTADELAERLRLQPSTVRRWARAGLIPRIRITPKVTRYDMDEVERALRDWGKGKAPKQHVDVAGQKPFSPGVELNLEGQVATRHHEETTRRAE